MALVQDPDFSIMQQSHVLFAIAKLLVMFVMQHDQRYCRIKGGVDAVTVYKGLSAMTKVKYCRQSGLDSLVL